jgi:hypothetical protein
VLGSSPKNTGGPDATSYQWSPDDPPLGVRECVDECTSLFAEEYFSTGAAETESARAKMALWNVDFIFDFENVLR